MWQRSKFSFDLNYRKFEKVASPFPKTELTKRSKFLIKNFRYFLEPPAACYGNISIACDKKKHKK